MELNRGPWADRTDAGRELGKAVKAALAGTAPEPAAARPADRPLVLGLPRGGVVVAAAVADVVGAELDVLVVRKAGVPWHRELALGAVTASGVRVENTDVIRHARLSPEQLELAFSKAEQEAQDYEHMFREGRPAAGLTDRIVIIADDGIATGATALAAAQLLQKAMPPPAGVILAVPVAPPETVDRLSTHVDDLIVLRQPAGFIAVGEWFSDFTQVDDGQVQRLMARYR